METHIPNRQQERLLSFDILSSVDALRYDLSRFDCVLPETRRQVLNQELSYIAEGIDRSSRTEFVFKRQGDDLVYFDDGEWRPYSEMLDAGRKAALHDAALDPRRQFLIEWSDKDIYQHEQNKLLQPGESRAWVSPYPYDIEQKYGKAFLKQCGLNPERKMGFIYLARCLEDGTIRLESQTIDNSDDEAFAAVLDTAKQQPAAEMDQLRDAYDKHMFQKYGQAFSAGRNEKDAHDNVWQEIVRNRDLADYLIDGLSIIAGKKLDRSKLEEETKRHIYGVWALFSKRLSGQASAYEGTVDDSVGFMSRHIWLMQEVKQAFKDFATEGRVLIGCGGNVTVLRGESDILSADAEDVHSAIFGGKGKTEVMKCVTCPLCKRAGVDANIVYSGKEKTITCSKCKQSKTYKN